MQRLIVLFTLAFTTLLVPAWAAAVQEPEPLDPEQVAAALERLATAWEDGEAPDRVAALEEATGLTDPRVIEWLAKGLKDREPPVVDAAIAALRYTPHADSLAALVALFKRDKKLRKDVERHELLLKAIGQQASPDALVVLGENPFQMRETAIARAHIFGLANVRTRAALEKLIALMRSAGPQRVQSYMDEFRLALMQLTGVDRGRSQEAWNAWWNDNKREFEVSELAPELPRDLDRTWRAYWGLPRRYERPPDREGRGGR